jgi:hypothetical protein
MVSGVEGKQCAVQILMRSCVFSDGLKGNLVDTSVKLQLSSHEAKHNIMSRQLKTQVDMFEWVSALHVRRIDSASRSSKYSMEVNRRLNIGCFTIPRRKNR